MEKLVVLDCFGQRIDSFLAEKLDLSRSKIQKLVKEGKILVNDQVVSNSYMVRENDAGFLLRHLQCKRTDHSNIQHWLHSDSFACHFLYRSRSASE